MDTNGRRNDVINALQGYLTILDDILRNKKLVWKNLPESTAQFEFYLRAVAMSPDVFKQHNKFDRLMKEISPEFRKALETLNTVWFQNNYTNYSEWNDIIDESVEKRARHYTNNLVKLGFTDQSRQITEVGDILLSKLPLHRDILENLLVLDNVNITYLRQLLKLRIFDKSGTRYYSPFCMAIYVLLRKKRFSQEEFCEMIQGLSPYHDNINYDNFIDNYKKNDIIQMYTTSVPIEIDNDDEIHEQTFRKYFTNKKSRNGIIVYYSFYISLRNFIINQTNENLSVMLDIYENNKSMLNKAFGYGNNIFKNRRGNRPSAIDFMEAEKTDFFTQQLNSTLYLRFIRSKTMDIIREYSDTTIRIFKATGLISFENGYVELVCSDLCKCIFDEDVIESMISGNDNFKTYEDINGSFCKEHSFVSILQYTDDKINDIIKAVRTEFNNAPIKNIPDIIRKRRKSDFATFIEKSYPEKKVKELLAMFSDRSNDGAIKEKVNPDATVPTIYEYIVGIAWYYFSDKTIDILSSFNLTLSANFEPLTHAGGGMGDIVIYNRNSVIMLEATLMNANSQKHGEWEPVLRHSVNLKAENEDKDVTTFFIADTFDFNTINLWKAISSVPLQSSTDKSKYTENVIIMPISSNELITLIDHKHEYNVIIKKIRRLFLKDITAFDKEWREKFISNIIL